MSKVKILLIGAAFAADLHMEAYSRCQDIAQVVGICSKEPERIDPLAGRYGITGYQSYVDIETAIAQCDCDLVDICVPNFLHYQTAIKALENGKHIIVEKPLATKLEDAEHIIKTAQDVGKRVYYAEDWLFAPALLKALSICDSKALGDINYIRARECHNGSHSPFAQTLEFCGGGSLIHLGIHPVCFMLALKNNRWKKLSAMTSGGLDKNLVHKKMEGEDFAVVNMEFEDGTTAVLEANYVSVGGMEDVIDFYGTKGCLHVDLTFSSPIHCFSEPGLDYTVEKADITTGWSRPAVDEKYNLGYVDEIRHFVTCAQQDVDAKVGLRGIDGLEALKVVKLAYKSAAEGVTIYNDKL